MPFGTTGGNGPALFYPYAFVERSEVQPYWDMASRYALADHMFSTATTDSFVAHQEILAGTTRLNSHESLVDTPSNFPWGCDAPKGTVTGVIYTIGRVNDVPLRNGINLRSSKERPVRGVPRDALRLRLRYGTKFLLSTISTGKARPFALPSVATFVPAGYVRT
jgi:hypothetical protein